MQREIGIIIRVKDAAKAKEEIKGIVDNKLLGNVKAATDNFKKMGDEVKTAGDKARQTKGEFDSFFSKLTKGAGALYAIRRGFSAAFTSFEAGAGLERASVQFESSIGNINTMLPQLRSATRGTVEDMKLLQTANRAVMEGLNPKNLTSMYRMATVASRKLGLESEQAIQTISNAIVRQDESALATLGTILKTNVGLRVQNALIAKNGGVMAGAAAIAIRQSVIMAELNKRFGGFNKLQEDSVEIIQQFRAAMTNLRMALGPVIGIVLAPLLKVITAIANSMASVLGMLKDNKTFRNIAGSIGLVIGAIASVKSVALISKMIGKIGLFTIGIKGMAVAIASVAAFKFLADLEWVSEALSKAATAVRVFYQLVTNFDDTTGLSKVLAEDKRALGGFYDYVKMGAQAFLTVRAAYQGFFQGLRSAVEGTLGGVSKLFGMLGDIPVIRDYMSAIAPIFDRIGQAASLATDYIKKFFDSLTLGQLDGIKRVFSTVAQFAPMGIVPRAVNAMLGDSQSPAAPVQQAMPEPQIREQNVQAVSSQEDYLPSILKSMNRSADTLDMLLQKEENKEVQRRVSPLSR